MGVEDLTSPNTLQGHQRKAKEIHKYEQKRILKFSNTNPVQILQILQIDNNLKSHTRLVQKQQK